MDTSTMRKPFLPLSITKSNLAIPRELMVDYEDGILYVKSMDGKRILELGKASSIDSVSDLLSQIIGNVDEAANSFEEIESRVTPIKQWKDKLVAEDDNDTVDTLVDIIKLFQDYGDSSETLKVKLDGKVNKVGNKGLSANNFTDELKTKLEGIEEGANKYVHPNLKACEYQAPVLSINNIVKPSVTVTKELIGLALLDPNAKTYTHPQDIQCTPNFVTSLNGKTGKVVLSKEDIGLKNVENFTPFISWEKTYLTGQTTANTGYQIISKVAVDDIIKEAAENINKPVFVGRTAAFLSFTELLTLSGMTGVGTKINSFENLHWNIYRTRGKLVRVCMINLVRGISYSNLEAKGLTTGDKIVTIRGKMYRIGLLPVWGYGGTTKFPDINSGFSSYIETNTSTITCYGGKGEQSKCTTTRTSSTAYESGYVPAWRPVIYEV